MPCDTSHLTGTTWNSCYWSASHFQCITEQAHPWYPSSALHFWGDDPSIKLSMLCVCQSICLGLVQGLPFPQSLESLALQWQGHLFAKLPPWMLFQHSTAQKSQVSWPMHVKCCIMRMKWAAQRQSKNKQYIPSSKTWLVGRIKCIALDANDTIVTWQHCHWHFAAAELKYM